MKSYDRMNGRAIVVENGTRKLRAAAIDKLERIAASTQHLRLASVNLIVAGEEDLAVRLDSFIDEIETINFERCH